MHERAVRAVIGHRRVQIFVYLQALSKLVLPDPFGPTIVTISPAFTSRLTFFKAVKPP